MQSIPTGTASGCRIHAMIYAAWLLLHDVAAPAPSHDHPLQVMATTAFHGGIWRCAYKQQSMGAYAYIAGKLGYSHAL